MKDPRVAALNSLMRHCARVETCTVDALRKLGRYELSDEEREGIVERLKNDGFIDDCRYARAFAGEKVRIGHQGRMKIRMALKQKGIDSELIDEALQGIDPEEYREAIEAALEPRIKGVEFPLSWQERGRLLQYAAGRGFEYDEVAAYLADHGIDID